MTKFYLTFLFLLVLQNISLSQNNFLQKAGSSSIDEALDVSIANNGDIYSCGYYNQYADFGNTQLPYFAYDEGFVAKQNSNGIYQWAFGIVGYNLQRVTSVAASIDGGVYATGTFSNETQFGNVTLNSNAGSVDVFIIKLSQSGVLEWIKTIGGPLTESVDKIVCVQENGQERILVIGQFRGTFSIGAVPLNSTIESNGQQGFDLYLTKLNSIGDFVNTLQLSSTSNDRATGMDTDDSGNIYITGHSGNNLSFNTSSYALIGVTTGYILKINALFNGQWLKQINSNFIDVNGLDVRNNSLLVGGDFNGNLSITGTSAQFAAPSNNSIFAVRFNLNGDFQHAIIEHSLNPFNLTDVAIDADDNSLITGSFSCTQTEYSSALNASGVFNSAGFKDIFLTRYNSQGQRNYMQQFGGKKNDNAYAMDIRNTLSPVIVGSFHNNFAIPRPTQFSSNTNNNFIPNIFTNIINQNYCEDVDYGKFVTLSNPNTIDVLSFSALDEDRKPFDFYKRPNEISSCERNVVPVQINSGLDTIRGCPNLRLRFISNHVDAVGPDFNLLWTGTSVFSGPNNINNISIQNTGTYYLRARHFDNCKVFYDTVYVIIDSVATAPVISSPDANFFGISEQHSFTSGNLFCNNKILFPFGETITFNAPPLNEGDSVVWETNQGFIINQTQISISQPQWVNYEVINQYGCRTYTCFEAEDYLIGPGGFVLCEGCPSLVPMSFGVSANDDFTSDTLLICPDTSLAIRLASPFLPNLDILLPAVGYYRIQRNSGNTNLDASFNLWNDSIVTFMEHNAFIYQGFVVPGTYNIELTIFLPPFNEIVMLHFQRTIVIEFPELPDALVSVISSTNGLCPGGTADISFNFNFPSTITFPFEPNSQDLENSPHVINTNYLGVYRIVCRFRDPTHGCLVGDSTQYNLQFKQTPAITMVPQNGIKCPQDSVSLSAPIGSSITWVGPNGEFGDDDFTVNANLPGDYNFNLTDFEGCVLLSGFKEVKNLNPIPAVGEYYHLCPGEFAEIKLPSDSGYYFYWQAPLTGIDSIKTIYQPGVYHVDTYICNEYTPLSFTIYQSYVNADIQFPDGMALCDDHPITLQAETGPYDYLWTPGNSTDTFIIADQTDYYKLQVTDTLNCIRRDSIYLTEHPNPPNPDVSAPPTCLGSNANLVASNFSNVIWFSIKDSLLYQGNPYSFQLNDTNIVVSAISLNSFGCYSDTISYEVPYLLHAQLPEYPDEMLYCVGDNANIVGVGGANIASISWIGPNNFQLTNNALLIDEINFGNTGNYILVPVPENGYCIVEEESILINAKTPDAPVVDYQNTICENGLIQMVVTAQPTYLYNWNGPNVFSSVNQYLSLANAQQLNAGTYILTSFYDGCYRNDSFLVNVLQMPNAPVIGHTAVACENQPYLVYDAGNGLGSGFNLNWLGAGNFQVIAADTILISALSMSDSGTYYLQYQNNICLSPISSLSIEVLPAPVFSFASEYEFCEGESIELTAPKSASAYLWSNGATSSSTLFDAPGSFWLVLEDANGCTYASNAIINEVYCDIAKVPNTFSPNGDGINDALQFTVAGGAIHGAFIFDRWGKMIKEITGGESLIWDGSNNSGEKMMNGTYFYILDVTMVNGNKKKVEGTIALFN